ncbi:NAD(P)-dependent dehydrogenase (short-subunit alcohol dehydrogenase family) [Microbacterium sp. BE35]|uniref:SDR family NAD(P)-dependent oxidoreductase n=1 Tax=Microbacterium sp. BE35 TaxID=2817773 RepID=UPI0028614CDE|nr:SDR family oxidoreductase [Microbacterium sp. BE35]MDR7188158.1 NAD(P)-dependent dehydrogenase (short-subunit alcohol dehydrogenase family) [Microbacterium sp. BE35]
MSRTVVITGGAGGLGRAAAQRLLNGDGSISVAVVDRAGVELDVPLQAAPQRWQQFACDVTSPADVQRCYQEISATMPPIHGLVNGAGTVDNSPSEDVELETIHRIFAVHLDGTVLWSQAVARSMMAGRGGSIVNIGSIVTPFGRPRRLAYAAAKSAIHSVTRTLAVEWASHGIRVNAVAPGYIRTPLLAESIRLGFADEDAAAGQHAMKRLGEPREVADAIAYLLSEQSSFVTGAVLRVDGGFSILKDE